MIEEILKKQYGISPETHTTKPFGDGLVNSTWVINKVDSNESYIFQKINNQVFKNPEHIAYNIQLLDDHLKKTHPDYLFTTPLKTIVGDDMVRSDQGYYRLFNFVQDSCTLSVLENADQAYEAAMQFARFTKSLQELTVTDLKITIPNFHDLSLRFQQFSIAIQNEKNPRCEHALDSIHYLLMQEDIVHTYEHIKMSDIIERVVHHDTKISNVLFDKNGRGLCVIDLDTVMPGYFISDVGDMMRTYLSPVTEEEADVSKIFIRDDFFEAILKGYLHEMKDILTDEEVKLFVYSGKFMIYMQALRFLTDYLNNDIYYGAKYIDHNLVRAKNQIQLLKLYMRKEIFFNEKLHTFFKYDNQPQKN